MYVAAKAFTFVLQPKPCLEFTLTIGTWTMSQNNMLCDVYVEDTANRDHNLCFK